MNIVRRTAATRILAVAVGVLAVGSALTALAVPAVAANKITVTNPGTRTTNPLSAKVSLQIKATDSAKSALSYAATGLPAGLAISKTTGLISGMITKASSGTVKVTVTDATKATGSASFTWTAKNTIVVANPGAQTTTAGSPVSVAVPAADDDKATTLAWTASGLPSGLSIGAATGIITGEHGPQRHVPGHGQGHRQDRIRCEHRLHLEGRRPDHGVGAGQRALHGLHPDRSGQGHRR